MATGGQSLGVIYHSYEIRGLAEAERRMAALEKKARNLGMGGGTGAGAGGRSVSLPVLGSGGRGAPMGGAATRMAASEPAAYVTPRARMAEMDQPHTRVAGGNLSGTGPLLASSGFNARRSAEKDRRDAEAAAWNRARPSRPITRAAPPQMATPKWSYDALNRIAANSAGIPIQEVLSGMGMNKAEAAHLAELQRAGPGGNITKGGLNLGGVLPPGSMGGGGGGGRGRGPGQGMGRRSAGGGGGGKQQGILGHPAAFGLFFNFMFGGWEVAKAQQGIQEAQIMASLAGQPMGQLAAQRQGIDAATAGILGSIGGLAVDMSGGIFGHPSPQSVRRDAMVAEEAMARQNMISQMQSGRIAQNQLIRAGRNPHAQGMAAIESARAKKLGELSGSLSGLPSENATSFTANEFAIDIGRRLRRMLGGSFSAAGMDDLELGIGERYIQDRAGRAGIRGDRNRLSQEERMIEADAIRDKIGLTKDSVLDRVGLQESMTAQAAAMDITSISPYAQGVELIGEAASARARTRDLKASGMGPEAMANDLLMRRRIDLAEKQYLKYGFTSEQIDREMAIGMSPEEKGALFSGFDKARSMMNGTLSMADQPGMLGVIGGQMNDEVEALRRLQESLERKLDELIGKLEPG